jgi:hypothetical protein
MNGLFQISTVFLSVLLSEPRPLIFFDLSLKAQVEILTVFSSLSVSRTKDLTDSSATRSRCNFCGVSCAYINELSGPILNGGILVMSKRLYFFLENAIIAPIIWFGPSGLVIQRDGFDWMNG